ncbi:c-type cytochrome [Pseudothauera nasutitermitis]|uniref:C-type cytochrome n=1 Tax=Pseudothauera nasutitermitis TaxID=2565930 RepID=A0A4S4AZK5_9RHOO|nr:c-type cytochrome [Pseudothauera nasutitermitis]THF65603.1 c-type cytochrome [Pseudothauera nasutitermitis]
MKHAANLIPLLFGVLCAQAAAESPRLSGQAAATLPLCASCHGVDGISSVGLYPNLAGQKAEYLVKQLNAFKHRERDDAVMSAMAEPLDDALIRELAAYFSALEPGR